MGKERGEASMKNIFKVVLLFVVGFGFLIYLTIPSNIKEAQTQNELEFKNLPAFFDVVNGNNYTKKDDFFKKFPLYLIVLNHDSLAVFSELHKKNINENIVLVANISNTPWLIKQIAVNGELEKMFKNSKINLINDSSGSFSNSLDINNNSQNGYFVYKVFEDGKITKIFQNSVKKGALQNGITKEEIETELENFIKEFNKYNIN
jgi:translation initiation factor 2 beta subunit (eIF-2beta)/eIF-5